MPYDNLLRQVCCKVRGCLATLFVSVAVVCTHTCHRRYNVVPRTAIDRLAVLVSLDVKDVVNNESSECLRRLYSTSMLESTIAKVTIRFGRWRCPSSPVRRRQSASGARQGYARNAERAVHVSRWRHGASCSAIRVLHWRAIGGQSGNSIAGRRLV